MSCLPSKLQVHDIQPADDYALSMLLVCAQKGGHAMHPHCCLATPQGHLAQAVVQSDKRCMAREKLLSTFLQSSGSMQSS